jgi:hypothetical protein
VSFASGDDKKAADAAEKAKLKEERLQNKRLLESCLTLVRSLYTREEVIMTLFISSLEKHPRLCDGTPHSD